MLYRFLREWISEIKLKEAKSSPHQRAARPRRFSGALGDVELDTLKQLEENFQTCLTIRI